MVQINALCPLFWMIVFLDCRNQRNMRRWFGFMSYWTVQSNQIYLSNWTSIQLNINEGLIGPMFIWTYPDQHLIYVNLDLRPVGPLWLHLACWPFSSTGPTPSSLYCAVMIAGEFVIPSWSLLLWRCTTAPVNINAVWYHHNWEYCTVGIHALH